MIEYITKDVTCVSLGIVAHGVNCQHKMASGVAKAIRNKWPIVYEKYMEQPKGQTMLGGAHVIEIPGNSLLHVANCYTQIFYGRGGGKYASPEAIEKSLTSVFTFADYNDLPIYVPEIGCGLGGLSLEKDLKPILNLLAIKFERVDCYVCTLPTGNP